VAGPAEGSADASLEASTDQEAAPVCITSAAALLKTLTAEGKDTFDAALEEVLREGVDRDVEVDITLPGGAWRRALFSLRALLRQSGEVSGAIICALDITDSARARQELEKRATYDNLTGCHNRSSIMDALQRALAREDTPGTGVVYVDLDKFKPVNDTLGHAAGDELLVLVAERLKQVSRDTDVVGRLGGDEFLIVLGDVPDTDTAMRVADRIGEVIADTFELTCGSAEVSASIGVACSNGVPIGSEELVKLADGAMYRSKQAGVSEPVLAV
jgi:diguanylate cyclase (GGDEF)-like protein